VLVDGLRRRPSAAPRRRRRWRPPRTSASAPRTARRPCSWILELRPFVRA